jgi:hypothetical protein
MQNTDSFEIIEAIISLAQDIARIAPECATKSMQIIDLVRELDAVPDRETIEDAIETSLNDSELSDPQLRTMTSAIVKAVRVG